jgi:hypothetical protein
MGCRSSKQTLPNKSLTKKKLNILFGPLSCRQGLQVHEYFLEILFQQLLRPLNEKCRTNIEVELGKALVLGLDQDTVSKGRSG